VLKTVATQGTGAVKTAVIRERKLAGGIHSNNTAVKINKMRGIFNPMGIMTGSTGSSFIRNMQMVLGKTPVL